MKTFKLISLTILLPTFFACQPSGLLKSEQVKNFTLDNYPTYGFYEIEIKGDTSSRLFEENVTLVKEAIRKNLQQRGLNETQEPALKINIALTVKNQIQTRQTDFLTDGLPRYMGQRRYSWKSQEVKVGEYKEGTMLIDLVDTNNNQMVWKGGSKGILPEKGKNISREINESVNKIFSKIP